MVKIYVDADACPVVSQIEKVASEFTIPVILMCDTNHILYSEYSQVIVVDDGNDSVDFALINKCRQNDIVVTQDYGVACMALSIHAFAIHQSGRWYTQSNIDELLMMRHISKKIRRSGNKNHMKGKYNKNYDGNMKFADSLRKLVEIAIHK